MPEMIKNVGSSQVPFEYRSSDRQAAQEAIITDDYDRGQEGIAQEGIAQEGIAQEGIAQESIAQEGIAQESIAQEGIAQESIAKESDGY